MAQKRMFSLRIIDTDDFLAMPTSARLLYFDLSMRADDDGFVDAPKKIMKITGASEDDIKILIGKQYLLPFEEGVCVIKHWHIHNLIRSDRYKETDYKELKSRLVVTDGKYHKVNVIPDGNQMATQYRLVKYRLVKDRKGKVSKEDSASPTRKEHTDIIFQEYERLYHSKPVFTPKHWKQFSAWEQIATLEDTAKLMACLSLDPVKEFNAKRLIETFPSPALWCDLINWIRNQRGRQTTDWDEEERKAKADNARMGL